MKYVGSKEKNVEYRKRPGAYAIIVNKDDDKVGIVTDGEAYFYLGGGIKNGETKLEALKREMIEEAGYSIKNIREFEEVGSHVFAEDKGFLEVIASVYIAEFDKKVVEPIEKDHKVLWVKPEEYVGKMFREWQRYIMERFIENRKKRKYIMRIGIDIDNVISNFDDTLLKEYLKHDKELRNTGIINENPEYFRRGMFDWTEDEEKSFYNDNIERWANNLKPLDDVSYYIQKLKEDGNEIYIISGRDNGEYENPYRLTEEWLEKYNIVYDKLILTNAYNKQEKAEICLKNNVDIMIEDSINTCINLIDGGIKTYTMNTRYNQKELLLNRVSKWKEIYEKISNEYKIKDNKKVNVILDTDTYNECDDQFALAYLLKSQDKFNIEAITVAPYHHDNNISIQEGTDKSYDEIIKICNWLNFDTANKVFKGSTDYVRERYNENNDAVNKIIEVANKNDKTYILAIGAITNVAIAIKKEPKIIDKIEIIWLGGHSFLNDNNREFNFKQDVQAVRNVFESKVKLTIIPCKNVASNLRTSIYELEHFLKGKSELCDYLCQRFYDDGVHGIQERRVVWDISVIAYMINKDWFETSEVSCPNINDDTSYELTENNHKITVVNYLNVDKIFRDLFNKLGESYEINK